MGDNTSIATAWLIAVVLSVVLPRAAAVAGTANQPPPGAVGVVLAFRVRALLALGKNDEALQAAKMYYDACLDKAFTARASIVALSASIDPVNHCHLR